MATLDELAERLRRHVVTLARTPRAPETPAHRAAGDTIRSHLEAAGFTIEEDRRARTGFTCVNLLTRPMPDRADLPLLIVGAHYDSVAGSPGADDNASGVAALLELATAIRATAANARTCRLQLAAYDLEEWGLIGSGLHSEALRRAQVPVRGMIALEMLGYTNSRPGGQQLPQHLAGLYPDVGDFIGICANEASRELLAVVVEAMRSVEGLPVEQITVPGRGELLKEVRLSDHSSFWDLDYKALMITDTSFYRNPHYHRTSDTPDTLDYAFLARVTRGVCAAVTRLLESASLTA